MARKRVYVIQEPPSFSANMPTPLYGFQALIWDILEGSARNKHLVELDVVLFLEFYKLSRKNRNLIGCFVSWARRRS